MPIPKTRDELITLVTDSYEKLQRELESAPSDIATRLCVDDWTVKDLVAVRVWWTASVIDWIEAGKRGEKPITPAPGYGWSETPRLNNSVVQKSHKKSFKSIRNELDTGYQRVLTTIESLNDKQLLEKGVFPWAGNYPISRWISINTARQYTTARTYIRRAARQ